MTRIVNGDDKPIVSPYAIAASIHPDIRVQRSSVEGRTFTGFLYGDKALWFGPMALNDQQSVDYITEILRGTIEADASRPNKGKRSS